MRVTENGLTGISGIIPVGTTFMTRSGALSGRSSSIAYPNRSREGPPDAIAFDLRAFDDEDDIGAGNGPLSRRAVKRCFSSCATASATILDVSGKCHMPSIETDATDRIHFHACMEGSPKGFRVSTPCRAWSSSMKANADKPYIPAWMFEQNLNPIHLLVLIYLWRRRNWDTGQCNPSMTTIANDVRISRRTAINSINELAKRGLLSRKSGHTGISNSYVLETPSAPNALVQLVHQPVQSTTPTSAPDALQGTYKLTNKVTWGALDALPPTEKQPPNWERRRDVAFSGKRWYQLTPQQQEQEWSLYSSQ